MKLIFIYGPPGVGKLSVAKRLEKITGYKLLHNHLTYDPVRALFEHDDPAFIKLVRKIRLDLLEAAARENIPGVIITFVYDKPMSDTFVKKVVKTVEKHKGVTHFIQLTCNTDELLNRIRHPDRKRHRKLTKVKILKEKMKTTEIFSSVPFEKNFVIDNTKLSPKKTAEKIKKYLKL